MSEFMMKIATVLSRCLLGLIFVVFGLNGFFHFLPLPPPSEGPASQFLSAMEESGYFQIVMMLQIIGGALLLTGYYLPLGMTLLGPIVINILMFHVFMDPKGLPVALLISGLSLFLLWRWRRRSWFSGLLRP